MKKPYEDYEKYANITKITTDYKITYGLQNIALSYKGLQALHYGLQRFFN